MIVNQHRTVWVILFVTLVVLGSLSLPGCGQRNNATALVSRYRLRGRIVQLDPSARLAVIKHQKIEGWMEAMTMEFPVKDLREFQALHVGDSITATVFVRDIECWIGEIHHEESQTK